MSQRLGYTWFILEVIYQALQMKGEKEKQAQENGQEVMSETILVLMSNGDGSPLGIL